MPPWAPDVRDAIFRIPKGVINIMMTRLSSFVRRAVPLLSTGMLLQAGGCDLNSLAAGVAGSVLNSLISSLVFGAFNLAGP